MATILGLDVGTNSLGWALIEEDSHGNPVAIRAVGVRIFQEAVEPTSAGNQRTPKNHKRRQARLARRQLHRRRVRRRALLRLLQHHGLLPHDPETLNTLLWDNEDHNPYRLRADGVHQRLDAMDFGRVLYHLNQRRGFRSNRKTRLGSLVAEPEVVDLVRADEQRELERARRRPNRPAFVETIREKTEDDESAVLVEIARVRTALNEHQWTLGEFLYRQPIRRRQYTDRAMHEEEFDRLWEAQVPFHPDLLTPGLKAAVHHIIFAQRPLKVPPAGRCELEPTRRRAPKALLEYQQFRLLQTLNHLEILPVSEQSRPLTPEERNRLLEALEDRQHEGGTHLSWTAVRTRLQLPVRTHFNLEESLPKGLPVNRTAMQLHAAASAWWADAGEEMRRRLVTDLLTIADKQALYRRLRAVWAFSVEEAYRLATVELEPGYASWSRKAIVKTLPGLERGLSLHDAMQVAGYLRADQRPHHPCDALPLPPDVRNPTVNRSLGQVRRVVNALLRTYGRPDGIRIELARDIALSKRDRERLQKQQRDNERVNNEARQKFAEVTGQSPRPNDLLKYRLWLECGHTCPYTGRPISLHQLWTSEVEIEHIIPYSRSLDDSFMNKTLTFSSFNARKGQSTPYEVFSGDPEAYAALKTRLTSTRSFSPRKIARFLMQTVPDGFVNRQLSDTRYIAQEVKRYVEGLGIPVEVTRGSSTAHLRHYWGLNHVLDPKGGQKTRDDHRHHVVDALVVALTSRKLLYRLTEIARQTGKAPWEEGFAVEPPWPTLFDDARRAIGAVVVSHETRHKIAGSLHDEMAYGPRKGPEPFVYRRPLSAFKKPGDEQDIIDPVVRQLVSQRLTSIGPSVAPFGPNAAPLLHTDGRTPIRSVRVRKVMKPGTYHSVRDRSGRVIKVHAYDNNHHVEVLERGGKRVGIFVTMMEAAQRSAKNIPIVQRSGPWSVMDRTYDDTWRFVMALHINDTIRLNEQLYRIQKLDASNNRVVLRALNDARTGHQGEVQKAINQLRGDCVVIDPLGQVRS